MILKFLGRGSAFNIREGNNSAYIKANNNLLLIDCGENIFERILNNNLLDNVKEVHVLITHLDSDHIGSLSSLIYYCYYMKNIVANIYFPIEDLYNMLKIQGHIEGKDYRFNHLESGINNFCTIANVVDLVPVSVPHIETLNCFGYLIYLKGNKLIWYSGDCSKVSDVINEYEINEFYQDTCLEDYEQNVHTSLRLLCESVPQELRNIVYCMHLDCKELITKAKTQGFNVVELI
ncbi:MBL fold metallo-hydrolase [Clostridium tyrobutyricum]|uniref:MBL fold metallo-hydrolase n=1 Tax=Clostridium tyrobutyricum TaxID=1519 RepID=UPI001C388887|nr:MBL fold metallo-hydrolase [Clostridium tyrobutyricum]MBV4441129.1 MBL fold metallo-hydrolase [Clostridium tyrobutyricum]